MRAASRSANSGVTNGSSRPHSTAAGRARHRRDRVFPFVADGDGRAVEARGCSPPSSGRRAPPARPRARAATRPRSCPAARSSAGSSSIPCDDLLADARRLPRLGHRVPLVRAVDRSTPARERADELRAVDATRCTSRTTPVVTDEVDRLAERVELVDDPARVLLLGRAPAVGHRCRRTPGARARRRRRGAGARAAGPTSTPCRERRGRGLRA